MESVTDLERARPVAQAGGRMADIGSPVNDWDSVRIPEFPVAELIQVANEETA
jgi:hypothetical protein